MSTGIGINRDDPQTLESTGAPHPRHGECGWPQESPLSPIFPCQLWSFYI